MNFGAWVRLDEADFPAVGGVLQARLEAGLVVYPRGKSAMVYYAGARDLGAAARALAAANPGARWLVRVSREPGRLRERRERSSGGSMLDARTGMGCGHPR
jgi:hypothetical protein